MINYSAVTDVLLDLWFIELERFRTTPKWRWKKRRQIWERIERLEAKLDG